MPMKSLVTASRSALVALCVSLLFGAAARAEPEPADPPARVGSVSALRGSVDSSPESGAAWEAAKLNQPVTSQTSLWAPPGSQAEVRIGSTSVRLDGNTQAVFSQVDDHGIALDVAQGTVRVRVRSLPTGDSFSLSADGVRAEAQAPGDYRVSYDPDHRAYTVRALAGRLRVVTPSNSFNLEAGQESLVENGGSELQLRAMGQRDDFDAWAEARDRDQDRLASARYVSPETTGIEALDEHGYWTNAPDYGAVWYPRGVPYGWAPYRYGHWGYVRPWGWTWIDDAPWGFAPFHYGRWALIGGAWGWVPGPIVLRPVYAPALVGYVGARSGNVSVSIGFGSGAPVGWFPLGPRERYYPPYRYSPRYVQQINVINVTHVVNPPPHPNYDRRATRPEPVERPSYRYAQRPDAVTMVSEDHFRNARPIGREHMDLTPQQAAQLQPVAASIAPAARAGGTAPGATTRPGTVPNGLPAALLPTPSRGLRPQDAARSPADSTRGGGPPLANAPSTGERRPASERDRRDGGREPIAPAVPGSPREAAPPAGPAANAGRSPGVPVAPVAPQPRPTIVPAERGVVPVAPTTPEPRRAERPRQIQREPGPPDAVRPEPGDRQPHTEPGDAGRNQRGSRSLPPEQPVRAAPAAPAPAPAPQFALPQAAPSPQVIPRPVPVPQVMPSPQVMPRPVAVPNPPPRVQQPRGREPGGERGGNGDRRADQGDGPQRGGGQRER
ncbi:DUF6600 domain-containing protein [Methylibium sp.]|uniref:DUF6600 domain-containing protein n=1 Tax=Methylibium sp. TaxID=2067992 RepID=UPI003D1354B2